MTTSDNEWQKVVQRMTTSDNEWYNGWQRVAQQVTTSDNEWQQITKNDNEWPRMTVIRMTVSKIEWFYVAKGTKGQSGSWIILFNFLCNV